MRGPRAWLQGPRSCGQPCPSRPGRCVSGFLREGEGGQSGSCCGAAWQGMLSVLGGGGGTGPQVLPDPSCAGAVPADTEEMGGGGHGGQRSRVFADWDEHRIQSGWPCHSGVGACPSHPVTSR